MAIAVCTQLFYIQECLFPFVHHFLGCASDSSTAKKKWGPAWAAKQTLDGVEVRSASAGVEYMVALADCHHEIGQKFRATGSRPRRRPNVLQHSSGCENEELIED